MKKNFWLFFGLVLFLSVFYIAGPQMPNPILCTDLPEAPVDPVAVESKLLLREKEAQPLKPDNEARIVWADSVQKEKTPFVLLYLHGFSASQYEGFPAHVDFARRYGCNLYLSRLAGHGKETSEPLLDMTPDNLFFTAKEALVEASKLGEKVIIMGTSTGGTLALALAAEFPEMVHSLILYSPNVRIRQKSAQMLSGPWGLQIARLVYGGKYRVTDTPKSEEPYWYKTYRLEAIVYLQQLMDRTMTLENFQRVKQPVFVGCYYKDEEHQDQTVSVEAIRWMFEYLGTDSDAKQLQEFPNAGDHVIACKLTSGAVDEVKAASFSFAEKVLGLKPLQKE